MRTCLVAIILSLSLLACRMDPVVQSPAARGWILDLVEVDAELTAVLLDEQQNACADSKQPTSNEQQMYQLAGYWARVEVLRERVAVKPAPQECRPLQEQYIEALEHYQRHFELMQAHLATQDQDYWLRAEDARRDGDRARRQIGNRLVDSRVTSLAASQR